MREGGGDGGGGDAGTVEDARPAEPDAGADTQGPATDTAPESAAGRPRRRRPQVAADLRGRDATSAPDTAADSRPSDLATRADTVAAGDAAPPNNGGVTGLTVVAANTTVGLDWPRIADATKYRVYWATAPGVSKSASALESPEPAMVHRGLTNGTAYYYAVAAVTAAGEGNSSSEATATPGGEWVLEELGAGDFDDVVTGGRVGRLAIKDRIHVVLLGEGYLEGDLGKLHDLATHDGTRGNDVDRWVDEVFRIEPYPQFRGAFVIWYLPRASEAHLGEGTTAFGVTITSSGVNTVTAAAAPLLLGAGRRGQRCLPVPAVVNHRQPRRRLPALRFRARPRRRQRPDHDPAEPERSQSTHRRRLRHRARP